MLFLIAGLVTIGVCIPQIKSLAVAPQFYDEEVASEWEAVQNLEETQHREKNRPFSQDCSKQPRASVRFEGALGQVPLPPSLGAGVGMGQQPSFFDLSCNSPAR